MSYRKSFSFASALALTSPALAQNALDRIDPAIGRAVKGDSGDDRPARSVAIDVAHDADTDAAQPAQGVFAGAIRVEGLDSLPLAAFGPAIEPFVGRQLSNTELRDLARAVGDVARARGYLFASAMIPSQRVDIGIVRVEVDEGRIDRIIIDGSDAPAAYALLSPLTQRPPTRGEVERRLMLVGDLPGLTLQKTRFERREGKGILRVSVRERRIEGRVRLDNDGPSEIGPDQLTIAYDLTGLLADADVLAVEAVVVPTDPRELGYVGARYSIMPDGAGTVVSLSAAAAYTHPGGALRTLGTKGKSVEAGLSASYALARSRRTSLWLGIEGSLRQTDQWQQGTLVRRDRTATIGVSLNGYLPVIGGRLRAGIGFEEGLGLPGMTRFGDALASRLDGDARFVKVYGWINWYGGLTGPLSLRLAALAQIADRPLLAGEEIAIGGPRFGRSYDYAERTGDQGVLGAIELQGNVKAIMPDWVNWAHVYVYTDAGHVANLENGFGGGSLFSAGGGARLGLLDKFDFGVETAFPLDQLRFTTGDRSPRFRLTLGWAFDRP